MTAATGSSPLPAPGGPAPDEWVVHGLVRVRLADDDDPARPAPIRLLHLHVQTLTETGWRATPDTVAITLLPATTPSAQRADVCALAAARLSRAADAGQPLGPIVTELAWIAPGDSANVAWRADAAVQASRPGTAG